MISAQRTVQGGGSSNRGLVRGEVHEEPVAIGSPKAVAGPIKSPSPIQAQRWLRYTVETFVTPEQFGSPQEYLAALSECLFEACDLTRTPRPDLSEVAW